MIISAAWNTMFTDYWKWFISELSGDENAVFLGLKSWWKDDIYWLRKSSSFDLFGDGKHGPFLDKKNDGKIVFTVTGKFLLWTFWRCKLRSFLSQKVGGKMIFAVYWKVLVLNSAEMGNTAIFWAKKLMQRWY